MVRIVFGLVLVLILAAAVISPPTITVGNGSFAEEPGQSPASSALPRSTDLRATKREQ